MRHAVREVKVGGLLGQFDHQGLRSVARNEERHALGIHQVPSVAALLERVGRKRLDGVAARGLGTPSLGRRAEHGCQNHGERDRNSLQESFHGKAFFLYTLFPCPNSGQVERGCGNADAVVSRGFGKWLWTGIPRFIYSLAKHCRRSPDLLGPEDIRHWLYYLIAERKQAASTVNLAINAVRSSYGGLLQREIEPLLHQIKRPRRPALAPRLYSMCSTMTLRSSSGCLTICLTTPSKIGLREDQFSWTLFA